MEIQRFVVAWVSKDRQGPFGEVGAGVVSVSTTIKTVLADKVEVDIHLTNAEELEMFEFVRRVVDKRLKATLEINTK